MEIPVLTKIAMNVKFSNSDVLIMFWGDYIFEEVGWKLCWGEVFSSTIQWLSFVFRTSTFLVSQFGLLYQIPGDPHVMTTSSNGNISALLALSAGNSPVTGEFPAQRPVTRSFDVFFDLRLKRLSKRSRGWWFETPSRQLWRHCNVTSIRFSSLQPNIIFRCLVVE